MNSDVIRLLPDSVANQIAAGEVIQRPASVIKELVENAVDAGATDISIIIKDGGRTLIQVVDDGCGMSPSDARMAFERHATSKIASADDLYSLHTMGFRGEALPSIAAVAQIDLRTMRHGDTIGTRLLISESRFEGQEPATCVPGTNLMVKNLFFHMPARRKFLKKDSVELGHIIHEFERLALVNIGIAFTLINNDATVHKFPAGTLKQRIGSLFGKYLESHIAPLNTETSLVKISGFVGMPRIAKKRGAQQFFFVNGRNMRHPFFHKAVVKCYEQLIAPDAQPSYFINFEVDPSTIDVNIHPQKNEIKFEHEQAIWQILEAAVRETLGKTQATGALDFDRDDAPDIPLFDPDSSAAMPAEGFDEGGFNPFSTASGSVPRAQSATTWQTRPSAYNGSGNSGSFDSWHRQPAPPQDWQKLYEDFDRRRTDAMTEVPVIHDDMPNDTVLDDEGQQHDGPRSFQLHNSYIVMASHSGIMVIRQRRAHIRILFDRYMAALAESGPVASQKLLFPEDIELPASQRVALQANMDRLASLGFEVSCSGRYCSITALPAMLGEAAGGETLQALLEEIDEHGGDSAEALNAPLARAMAESSAIKDVQPLSQPEIDTLTADLFRCAEPSYTPDGARIIAIIGNDDISALFARGSS
ncbi:MAG: DNA mismatch repair endonuclease MutL [Muribaculaceae bacterium]|nr:DNA mismatch repair endonuclease MutL [Muribaculaceae bacterium]